MASRASAGMPRRQAARTKPEEYFLGLGYFGLGLMNETRKKTAVGGGGCEGAGGIQRTRYFCVLAPAIFVY